MILVGELKILAVAEKASKKKTILQTTELCFAPKRYFDPHPV